MNYHPISFAHELEGGGQLVSDNNQSGHVLRTGLT